MATKSTNLFNRRRRAWSIQYRTVKVTGAGPFKVGGALFMRGPGKRVATQLTRCDGEWRYGSLQRWSLN